MLSQTRGKICFFNYMVSAHAEGQEQADGASMERFEAAVSRWFHDSSVYAALAQEVGTLRCGAENVGAVSNLLSSTVHRYGCLCDSAPESDVWYVPLWCFLHPSMVHELKHCKYKLQHAESAQLAIAACDTLCVQGTERALYERVALVCVPDDDDSVGDAAASVCDSTFANRLQRWSVGDGTTMFIDGAETEGELWRPLRTITASDHDALQTFTDRLSKIDGCLCFNDAQIPLSQNYISFDWMGAFTSCPRLLSRTAASFLSTMQVDSMEVACEVMACMAQAAAQCCDGKSYRHLVARAKECEHLQQYGEAVAAHVESVYKSVACAHSVVMDRLVGALSKMTRVGLEGFGPCTAPFSALFPAGHQLATRHIGGVVLGGYWVSLPFVLCHFANEPLLDERGCVHMASPLMNAGTMFGGGHTLQQMLGASTEPWKPSSLATMPTGVVRLVVATSESWNHAMHTTLHALPFKLDTADDLSTNDQMKRHFASLDAGTKLVMSFDRVSTWKTKRWDGCGSTIKGSSVLYPAPGWWGSLEVQPNAVVMRALAWSLSAAERWRCTGLTMATPSVHLTLEACVRQHLHVSCVGKLRNAWINALQATVVTYAWTESARSCVSEQKRKDLLAMSKMCRALVVPEFIAGVIDELHKHTQHPHKRTPSNEELHMAAEALLTALGPDKVLKIQDVCGSKVVLHNKNSAVKVRTYVAYRRTKLRREYQLTDALFFARLGQSIGIFSEKTRFGTLRDIFALLTMQHKLLYSRRALSSGTMAQCVQSIAQMNVDERRRLLLQTTRNGTYTLCGRPLSVNRLVSSVLPGVTASGSPFKLTYRKGGATDQDNPMGGSVSFLMLTDCARAPVSLGSYQDVALVAYRAQSASDAAAQTQERITPCGVATDDPVLPTTRAARAPRRKGSQSCERVSKKPRFAEEQSPPTSGLICRRSLRLRQSQLKNELSIQLARRYNYVVLLRDMIDLLQQLLPMAINLDAVHSLQQGPTEQTSTAMSLRMSIVDHNIGVMSKMAFVLCDLLREECGAEQRALQVLQRVQRRSDCVDMLRDEVGADQLFSTVLKQFSVVATAIAHDDRVNMQDLIPTFMFPAGSRVEALVDCTDGSMRGYFRRGHVRQQRTLMSGLYEFLVHYDDKDMEERWLRTYELLPSTAPPVQVAQKKPVKKPPTNVLPASSIQKSSYELLREANIRRNTKLLKELGIE